LPTSEEKWKDILENAPVGIFQSTPDGRFIAMNPTLASQFGYSSPQEMINDVKYNPSAIQKTFAGRGCKCIEKPLA
jgi:PAS domain S-box-containing protein